MKHYQNLLEFPLVSVLYMTSALFLPVITKYKYKWISFQNKNIKMFHYLPLDL